ncbi:MAG: hypothetical protein HY534_08315 [Chloroflexi bacterium]|nr:hypothetical protein [Chloroflexota bacterium]
MFLLWFAALVIASWSVGDFVTVSHPITWDGLAFLQIGISVLVILLSYVMLAVTFPARWKRRR